MTSDTAAAAGDFWVSMPRTSNAGRPLGVMVPRAMVAPLLASRHAAHAAVITGDTPFGRLMQEHLLALHRHRPQLTAAEGEAVVRATAHLLAVELDRASTARSSGSVSTHEVLLSAIKIHIERNLLAPTLGVNQLSRRFSLSRATLYRVFKSESGLGRYLQHRRLRRAFGQLVSPEYSHWRIIDFALDSRFSSDSGFTRAFRRQFGITPRELRTQAELARNGARAPLEAPEVWLEVAKRAHELV